MEDESGTAVFRITFKTDAADHVAEFSRERAVSWIQWTGVTQYGKPGSTPSPIEDLDDDDLARALTAATARFVDGHEGSWVRVMETGADDPGPTALRADAIRSISVTITADEPDEGRGVEPRPLQLEPPVGDLLN